MGNQSEWRAKLALICYLALIGGIFLGSIIMGFVLFGMGIDYLDSPFPSALIATPVNEIIILGVTLLFARYKGGTLTDLGLKKGELRNVSDCFGSCCASLPARYRNFYWPRNCLWP